MIEGHDSGGVLSGHEGLPWPEDYRHLKPILRERWGLQDEIYLHRRLGGLSGAAVFAADVTSRDFTGQAILKLDQLKSVWPGELTEAERHRRAFEASPEYAAKHLPQILHTLEHENAIAILSTIAGRGLEYATPWAECSYDRQLETVEQLSGGLLENWNAGYRMSDGMLAPIDLLRDWLGYRIDPKEGAIHSFLENDCGLTPAHPSFFFEGHWYPNALAFATGAARVDGDIRLRALKGNIHGDLHGYNVLVPARQDASARYYLIDLALYGDDCFLLYDHAYFELSQMLRVRKSIGMTAWKSLLDTPRLKKGSIRNTGMNAEDLGLNQLIDSWRHGVTDWAERNEAHRLSTVENQSLLARVAVGLNFVNKPLSIEQRRMAFLYACCDLKTFLKFNRLDWPKHGPPIWAQGIAPQWSEPSLPAPATAEPPAPAKTEPPEPEDAEPPEPEDAEPAEAAAAPAAPARRVRPIARIAAAALLFVVLAGGLWLWRPWTTGENEIAFTDIEFPLPSRPSIVVLPFDPLSSGENTKMMAAGMTAAITATLAQVPELFVTSRGAAAAFKGQDADPRDVMAAFDVRYVLEGGLTESNGRLRVQTELIDASNGEIIWTERFDKDGEDIFALEDEIALSVLLALQVKLTDGEQAALRGESTSNIHAYLLYVQALNAYRQLTRNSLAEARRLCDRALDLDPSFRQALVLKAWTHVMEANLGYSADPEGSLERAKGLLAAAGDIGGELSETERAEILITKAFIDQMTGRFNAAITHGEKAAELAPNNADLLATFGEILYFSGEYGRSIATLREAIHRNPSYPSWYVIYLSRDYARTGKAEAAIHWAKVAVARAESEPLRVLGLANLAFVYQVAGRTEEAKLAVRELRGLAPDFSIAGYRQIQPYRHEHDWRRFAEALRQAGLS